MTTFQAIVYSIVQGFAEFLPVGSSAHQLLVPHLLGWPAPTGAFAGALALGAFLSVLIFFRHDWASIISSFLQVIIFRKRPMTLDERLPMFMTLALLPSAAAWYYLRDIYGPWLSHPGVVAAGLGLFALPLAFADSMSRRNKGMFDWNWLDCLLVGIGNMMMFVPGCGRMTGALTVCMLRNYNREAAAKFALFTSMPVLGASAYQHLEGVDIGAGAVAGDVGWLTFSITVVVTFFCGILAIGGLTKALQRKGFGEYVLYRLGAAITAGVVIWTRSG